MSLRIWVNRWTRSINHVSKSRSSPQILALRSRTLLVEMVWLLVADSVQVRRSPGFRPPLGRLLIFAGVRMMGLLLGLDGLYPSLCNEFACSLLAVLEALLIKVPYHIRVPNSNALLGGGNRHRWVVLLVQEPTGSVASGPLPRLKSRLVVEGFQPRKPPPVV